MAHTELAFVAILKILKLADFKLRLELIQNVELSGRYIITNVKVRLA